MVKLRLWGEPDEMEKLIELICNELPAIRVLSVSKPYKDRGASVYNRCYLDVAINKQSPPQPTNIETAALCKGTKTKK